MVTLGTCPEKVFDLASFAGQTCWKLSVIDASQLEESNKINRNKILLQHLNFLRKTSVTKSPYISSHVCKIRQNISFPWSLWSTEPYLRHLNLAWVMSLAHNTIVLSSSRQIVSPLKYCVDSLAPAASPQYVSQVHIVHHQSDCDLSTEVQMKLWILLQWCVKSPSSNHTGVHHMDEWKPPPFLAINIQSSHSHIVLLDAKRLCNCYLATFWPSLGLLDKFHTVTVAGYGNYGVVMPFYDGDISIRSSIYSTMTLIFWSALLVDRQNGFTFPLHQHIHRILHYLCYQK